MVTRTGLLDLWIPSLYNPVNQYSISLERVSPKPPCDYRTTFSQSFVVKCMIRRVDISSTCMSDFRDSGQSVESFLINCGGLVEVVGLRKSRIKFLCRKGIE